MSTVVSQITREGLWSNNPALVQLLGLCPLMAVSTSVATSLGLGLTTLFVLTASNLVISAIRHLLDQETRLPVQILVIATFVTIADLGLQYRFFELHQQISLFVALIVTNCTLLGRAEAFASRNPIATAGLDGIMMGSGFLIVLLLMGAIREALGRGTLFAGIDILTGLPDLTIHLGTSFGTSGDTHLLLMLMPPGAFITLGCLIALKNAMEIRQK